MAGPGKKGVDPKPIAERFWAKVDKNGPTPMHRPELGPCWVWMGARHPFGHGHMYVQKGKYARVHRLSFFLEYGRWPNPCACHECDNPSCVRPSHIFEGTHADNNRDMSRKGRHFTRTKPERCARGERHGMRRLSWKTVQEIRKRLNAGESQYRIAEEYKIAQPHVSRIHLKQVWKKQR